MGLRNGITSLWSFEAQREIALISHQQLIKQVAFMPTVQDGKTVLATATKTIQFWEIDHSPEVMHFNHYPAKEPNETRGILLDGKFSSDGEYFATSGEDKTVVIRRFSTAKIIATLQHSHLARIVSFSIGSQYLLTASDYETTIWDWQNNTETPILRMERGYCSIFSPDSKYVAISTGKTVKIIDWMHNCTVFELTHEAPISSLNFSPDSNFLVAGSIEAITIVWEIKTGKEVKKILPK